MELKEIFCFSLTREIESNASEKKSKGELEKKSCVMGKVSRLRHIVKVSFYQRNIKVSTSVRDEHENCRRFFDSLKF